MPELLVTLAIVGFLAVIALLALRDMAAADTVSLAADRLAAAAGARTHHGQEPAHGSAACPALRRTTLDGGWQFAGVAGDHAASEPPFSVVALNDRRLRITLRERRRDCGTAKPALDSCGILTV